MPFCAQCSVLTACGAGHVQVRSIAELVLAQTAARLAQRDIGLEVTEATMLHICEEGYAQVRPSSVMSEAPPTCDPSLQG
jgi:hypothetical protein